jgi:predicted Co/Zn/Cd cation transporter (cation efflux family)
MTESEKLERRGLWLSILGALFMAGLGIGFALVTQSDAVLLDGLFSLIGFAIGLLSLRVATLVRRPDDEIYHFGYAAYEPILNLSKGLLMAFVTLFALVSAVMVVLDGGRQISAGWASVYAWVAAAGCFSIAVSQRRLARTTGSPLLEVDSKNWLIDGLMSVAVGVAFLVASMMQGTSFGHLLPYADPVVVIVLVVLSLPIPASIVRQNWGQLVGKAPTEEVQKKARGAVASVFGGDEGIHIKVRMQQFGRVTYVQVYVIDTVETDADLDDLDRCRDAIHDGLAESFRNLAVDVVFTRDPRWVAHSVGVPSR